MHASALDDLCAREAYPSPLPTAVTRVETHASVVFLTDGEAWKVKKPVDLGFLDYTTEPKRRAACEAETRLNRRLAPDVYLGVAPVRRGGDGRLTFAADGPIVDWAVRMRRVHDDARADLLLARGALDPKAIDALAAHLARFHAEARRDAEVAAFGDARAIAESVHENFDQTGAWLARILGARDADALRAYQLGFLEERRDLFAARVAEGRIVEGHGDLRLEHVYFEAGRITVLDAIEFNDRFRMLDVCADVTFLSMDLAYAGRADLEARLLAAYARASGDYDLYALADFYTSYRAFVRGKIGTIIAGDAGQPADVQRRAEESARRYFLLALSATRRSAIRPRLVAVGGIIASGKSTLADAIAPRLGAPVVDADRTRKELVGVTPETRLHEPAWRGAYDSDVTARVYAEVLRRARVVLASGRPVVVEASFRSRALRAEARATARALGVPFVFVECRADAATCRARLEARARTRSVSDGRLAIFDAFAASFEPVTEFETEEHLVVDTCAPLDASLARIDAAVPTWPEGLVT